VESAADREIDNNSGIVVLMLTLMLMQVRDR